MDRQRHGQTMLVSVLLHPLAVGSAPLLWQDWSRREHRRACQRLVRHQQVEVSLSLPADLVPIAAEVILSRARCAQNRRSGQVTVKLFGIPVAFATFLGLPSHLW